MHNTHYVLCHALQTTIVGLAQDFVGSNNINLLFPAGQFGTRLQGGKDAASARWAGPHNSIYQAMSMCPCRWVQVIYMCAAVNVPLGQPAIMHLAKGSVSVDHQQSQLLKKQLSCDHQQGKLLKEYLRHSCMRAVPKPTAETCIYQSSPGTS